MPYLNELPAIIHYASYKRKWYNVFMSDNTEVLVTETAVGEFQGYKLDVPTKMKVIAMMARGEKYETIQRILLEDHQIEYTIKSLYNLRDKHKDTIAEMELMILEKEASDSEQIRVKSLRQLNRKLDKASADELMIAQIDKEYREGVIENLGDYRRRKAGLLNLSVKDLTDVSKEMSAQTGSRGIKGAHGLPPGDSGVDAPDPKWVEALMAAVQRGDTITMQQLTLTPNA